MPKRAAVGSSRPPGEQVSGQNSSVVPKSGLKVFSGLLGGQRVLRFAGFAWLCLLDDIELLSLAFMCVCLIGASTYHACKFQQTVRLLHRPMRILLALQLEMLIECGAEGHPEEGFAAHSFNRAWVCPLFVVL